MNPHLSSGIFSQVHWPGVGSDRDECWALSDMMAVHAVAPWVSLPTAGVYRAAAGNPDDPGQDGGTLYQSAKAIRTLWPDLGKLIVVCEGVSWATFKSRMTKDKVASLSVLSGALPPSHTYGFYGNHRVAVALVDSGWKIANPLAPPHARWRDISESALRNAVEKYPAAGTWAIVMPSVAAAFKTHPLYP